MRITLFRQDGHAKPTLMPWLRGSSVVNDRPWLIEMKIEPKLAVDAERLLAACIQMASEDTTFEFSKDPESAELIVMGLDEPSLDRQIDALHRFFKIDVLVGPPQVAYRVTLARSTEIDYTHKKQTGSTGQFARVKLRLEPNERDAGNIFESHVAAEAVPEAYIPGVEKGVQSAWVSGVPIDFPMVDTKVTLLDGAYHKVDSSTSAFEIAARTAMREGCKHAGMTLLEPIMDVEVVSPRDCASSVIRDIDSRRGEVNEQQILADATVIRAHMPLATLFGYKNALLAISNGRASHTLRFSHYAEVPRNIGPDRFPPAVGMRA